MPGWKGKTRGGVLGNLFFVYLIRFFGRRTAYFFIRFVAIYFLVFTNKKHIFYYFNRILKFEFFKSVISIYKNYILLGEILVDKFCLLSGFKSDFSFNFDGEEYLREMTEGGILISAHLGSWEIAGQLLERLETNFNIVMYDAEHKKIKEQIEKVMVKKNFRIIVIKDDLSHIYEIKNALERKELICLHGDRFIEGSKTVLKNFLGFDALFPAGPFYLVSKFKVPVSFVFALKETHSHYHFFATKSKLYIFSSKLSERDNNINQILDDYLNILERKVISFPTQWFNYHQFWNKYEN